MSRFPPCPAEKCLRPVSDAASTILTGRAPAPDGLVVRRVAVSSLRACGSHRHSSAAGRYGVLAPGPWTCPSTLVGRDAGRQGGHAAWMLTAASPARQEPP